ncbi:MAG: penicillin-binding protein 2 [Deltaproteobacteria bacterium]|nr:penicillin-binding protein 2 [Deltaproteobacteria bacterium]MBI3296341.1 penicillin-binding protein 2 [Deltaproteobacteria bacterium]
MIGREDEIREYRNRIPVFFALTVVGLAIISVRLFYLQVIRGDELRRFSDANRLKKEKLFPLRGTIYDREGRVIVDNRASFDVVLFPQYYKFDEQTNARLAVALQIDPMELNRRLQKANRARTFRPVLLKSNVGKDIIAAIEMNANLFAGVDIEANVARRYPIQEVAAQLLGYVGEVENRDIQGDSLKQLQMGDYIGKMGIERTYDSFLRGVNGTGYVEVDAMGRRRQTEGAEKLLGFVAQTEPVPGDNLYLTLDLDLEKVAAEALKKRNFHGAVLAMDPRNGEVLAMVNYPSYDPGSISGREVDTKVWSILREDKDRPLRNRAIQDHYPPGSTFKVFMALAGLAEEKVKMSTTVQCNGQLRFGNRTFHCWKKHGLVDFTRSIRESCDIFYYLLGDQLGIDPIAKYARLFGLGEKTGIRISSEQKGLIPDSEWKLKVFGEKWQPGETLSVAIGQGFVATTPLQLVTAYSAVANGGFVFRPFLVKRIEAKGGEKLKEYQPELIRKIDIAPDVIQAVKEGLYQVVNVPGGTAFGNGRSKLTVISGKTGTAQVRRFADMKNLKCENLPYKDRHMGWFVGYAPRENPEIAVVAISEHACHPYPSAQIVRDVIEAFVTKQRGREVASEEREKVKEKHTLAPDEDE